MPLLYLCKGDKVVAFFYPLYTFYTHATFALESLRVH